MKHRKLPTTKQRSHVYRIRVTRGLSTEVYYEPTGLTKSERTALCGWHIAQTRVSVEREILRLKKCAEVASRAAASLDGVSSHSHAAALAEGKLRRDIHLVQAAANGRGTLRNL